MTMSKIIGFVGRLLFELYFLAGGICFLTLHFMWIRPLQEPGILLGIPVMGFFLLLMWLLSFGESWARFPIATLIQEVGETFDYFMSTFKWWGILKASPKALSQMIASYYRGWRDFMIARQWWLAGYQWPSREQVQHFGRPK